MLGQDKRLDDRVKDLELWRRLGNFGTGGGGSGSVPMESFHLVGQSGEPAFTGGWVNYDTSTYNAAGFRKDPLGRVLLKGLVKNGSIGSGVFQLPAGYRPIRELLFAPDNNGSAATDVRVRADGVVLPAAGVTTWLSLDGIIFDTESVTAMPTGPAGPMGPPGPASTTYTHTQSVLSATWVVAHNLSKRPSIAVVDSGDSVILPNVHYDSDNQITVTFDAPTSGKAYCN
jgi:hypothetical protein